MKSYMGVHQECHMVFLLYSDDMFPVNRYKLLFVGEVNHSHPVVDEWDPKRFPHFARFLTNSSATGLPTIR